MTRHDKIAKGETVEQVLDAERMATILENIQRALRDHNWSVAYGNAEIGLAELRKAA